MFSMQRLLFGACLHNAHIGSGALLIHAVQEGLRCDDLSLGAFLSSLTLFIQQTNVVNQQRVERMAVLRAVKSENLNNISSLEFEMVHRVLLQIVFIGKNEGVLHFIH